MNDFSSETWHKSPFDRGERRTTVGKFVSPFVVPHGGRLASASADGLVIERTVDGTAQSTLLTQQDKISLLLDKSIVQTPLAISWKNFVSLLLLSAPHAMITVQPMFSPDDRQRSFGENNSTKATLAALELFYSNRDSTDLDFFDPQTEQVYGRGEDDGDDASSEQQLVAPGAQSSSDASSDGEHNSVGVAHGTLVCIYLNDSAILKMMVAAGDDLSDTESIWSVLGRTLHAIMRKPHWRVAPRDIACMPRIASLGERHGMQLRLFDYQERFVYWLLELERAALEGRKCRLQMRMTAPAYSHAPLHYDSKAWSVVSDSKKRQRFTDAFQCRGGIVASKTGTGKTTIAIALAHVQKCLEATAHRCASHVGDAGAVPEPRRRLRAFAAQTPDWRYYADCTLVVCPRQMVKQWIDELVKTVGATIVPAPACDRELRVFGVNGLRDLRTLKFATLQNELDVLVVSKEIFKSSAYRQVEWSKQSGWDERVRASIDPINRNMFLQAKYNFEHTTTDLLRALVGVNQRTSAQDNSFAPGSIFESHVPLHAIRFRRLFVDEIHELESSWTVVERAVASLVAETTHGITATLHAESDEAFGWTKKTMAGGLPALLGIDQTGREALKNVDRVLRYYFVKKFAMTADCDERMPPLHFHCVRLDLSRVERAVYTSIAVHRERQQLMFCSHHLLQDEQWQRLLQGGSGVLHAGAAQSAEQAAEALQSVRRRRLQELQEAKDAALANERQMLSSLLLPMADCALFARLRDIYGAEQRAQHQVAAQMQRVFVGRRVTVLRTPANEQLDAMDSDDRAALTDKIAKQTQLQQDISNGTVDIDNARREQFLQEFDGVHEALSAAKAAATRAENAYSAKEREIHFFEAVVRRLQESQRVKCAICVDEYDDDDEDSASDDKDSASDDKVDVCTLTVCGHEFCRPCATQWFACSRRCPSCRQSLDLAHDLRHVALTRPDSLQQEPQSSANDQSDSPAVRYGSKIAALLALFAELRRRDDFRKVVVYAQFERLLQLVASALRECGQRVLTLDGSAEICQRSLERFRSDPNEQIMLLSSERSISGVHLVEANHLIALHPLIGSREEVYAKNWQAIGRIRRIMQRSDCHVWSLVTRNTIEERLYQEQKQEARNRTRNDARVHWH